jgi:hypothetical protein
MYSMLHWGVRVCSAVVESHAFISSPLIEVIKLF